MNYKQVDVGGRWSFLRSKFKEYIHCKWKQMDYDSGMIRVNDELYNENEDERYAILQNIGDILHLNEMERIELRIELFILCSEFRDEDEILSFLMTKLTIPF